MNVSELMEPTSNYVGITSTVTQAARLMRDTGLTSLVVMSDGELEGIISESDMVLGCMADGHTSWKCRVDRHMVPQSQSLAPDTHIGDASLMMIDGEFDCIPVMENGRLAGMLTSESIFGAIDSEMAYSTV